MIPIDPSNTPQKTSGSIDSAGGQSTESSKTTDNTKAAEQPKPTAAPTGPAKAGTDASPTASPASTDKKPATGTEVDAAHEPMRREIGKMRRRLRVGIFSLVGLVITIIGVFAISERDNIFTKTFPMVTRFKSVDGLKSGANILMNGLKIGTVTEVALKRDTASYVQVDMAVQEKYRDFIRTTATASVAQQGFIGDKQIELIVDLPGGRRIRDGDTLTSVSGPGVVAIIDDARGTLKRVDHLTSSMDTMMSRLSAGKGTLGKLMTDDGMYNSVTKTLDVSNQSMASVSRDLNTVTSTLSRSARGVDSLTAATRTTLANLDKKLNAASANVDQVTKSINTLITDVNDPKGSIGAMLHDRSIYDSLQLISSSARSALRAASAAGKEFALTMRGLRSGILGSIFNGNNDERKALEEKERQLEEKAETLRKQEEELNKRMRSPK